MQIIDTEESLISHRDSTLLKGILIILIVLGHNGILMGKAPGLSVTAFNDYLYSFHVYLFLILPFFYNIPPFTKHRVKKDFTRMYKPYTLIFIALLLTNVFILRQGFEPGKTIVAYIAGDQQHLKEAVGAFFPWFLPTMFSLLFLRNYILNKNNRVLFTSLTLSLAVFFAIRILFIKFGFDFIGSVTAIAYFSIAVACRYLYEKLHGKRHFNTVSILMFISSTAIFFTFYPMSNILLNITRYAVLPISALFTLIYLVNRLRIQFIENILSYLGKESLPIYMVHVFVYNLLVIAIHKIQIPLDLYSGIASFVLTFIITLLIIYLCKKINIYKYIFR